MHQELTISKEIIKFLYDNAFYYKKDNIGQRCFETIEDNFIVCDDDKTYFKILFNEIDNLPEGDVKKTIQSIIDNWLYSNKVKIYQSKENYVSELELCKISSDKIFLDPDKSNEYLIKKRDEIPSVEFHNKMTFIQPGINHRFKKVPIEYRFEKEIKYNLNVILEPFFRYAKEIIVIDPYLPNKKAIYNFYNLVSIFPKNSKIILRTYNEKDYIQKNLIKAELYKNYKEIITKIRNNGYDITEKELKHSRHIDRYICVDSIEISLPGGFDFLDENGFVKLESKSEIKKISITFRK